MSFCTCCCSHNVQITNEETGKYHYIYSITVWKQPYLDEEYNIGGWYKAEHQRGDDHLVQELEEADTEQAEQLNRVNTPNLKMS